MTEPKPALRDRASWKALEAHHSEIEPRHLRELFDEDPGRGERLIAEGAGLFLDYSKHRVTDETLKLLSSWRSSPAGEERRDAMFARRAHQHFTKTAQCFMLRCGCRRSAR